MTTETKVHPINLTGPALVAKAWEIAEVAHAGQTRANGITPYIAHPRRVAELFEREYKGLYLYLNGDKLPDEYYRGIATCILHDVAEDCDVSFDDLASYGFDSILPELRLLTKYHGASYLPYLLRLKESENILVLRIKLCDITANEGDIDQIPSKGKQKSLRTKYELSRYILTH